MHAQTDGTFGIATDSGVAARQYRTGLRLLVDGSGDPRPALRAALEADVHLAVAHAALAAEAMAAGDRAAAEAAMDCAVAAAPGSSRRERQQVEIVELLLRGSVDRARALGAAHLTEFQGDALVRHLLGLGQPAS